MNDGGWVTVVDFDFAQARFIPATKVNTPMGTVPGAFVFGQFIAWYEAVGFALLLAVVVLTALERRKGPRQ